MSAEAIPAGRPHIGVLETPSFRLVMRAVLALLALWLLHIESGRYDAFHEDYLNTFHLDSWLWLLWMGSALAAGLLFGLAAWLPFTPFRYLWNRLLLAALALLPVAHYWLVWGYLLPNHHKVSGWLATSWLWGTTTQVALAVPAGVAVASGFSPEASRTECDTERRDLCSC